MCKAGVIEDAHDLFCRLSLKGVKPDVVAYNTMISGLCNNRLKHEACALFSKMKQDGPLPDDLTYNALIRAHLEDGDKAASAEFIKEMRSRGFAGDASTSGLVTYYVA
ncbi:pentatricopeptide repeat-containing protein At1g63080, mitochondrial-like [Brassica napus]|nr:PREDICTED: pentatricopeptide repeat-containing protein At1g63080, mitochondrial-like [Brassica oleracea var. oleracea]XP_013745914.1 pentatricopeptide repeat-containing protein At1g63080, mitochondrial-like [Brassica napus]